MSNDITLTAESIEKIARRVAEKSVEIDYEVRIPSDEREGVQKGASLFWEHVLEHEYQYIDSAQDPEVMEDICEEAGLDIDSLLEANETLKVEHFWFPDGEGKPVSLEGFRVALVRAVISDLASAWMATVREVIEEVCGLDPLGGNDGLTFPEE